MPFVLAATETGAAIAAVAQAEVTGRPGVCLTTLGPGVASVVNGVACASLERAPLLVLTDSHAASAGGIFEHQRLDHRALLTPVTKWSATICAGQRRCRRPRSDRPRDDGSARPGAHRMPRRRRGPDRFDSRPSDVPGSSRSASVRMRLRCWTPALLEPLLSNARTPLLLVGLGARRPLDAEAIATLCASHGVPAMVTYKAKGVVPDTDAHFAGVFTNGAIEQAIVAQADLLIGVGLDPVELLPRPWTHAQPIVNITPWAVDDRHVPFAAQLVADVPSGMQLIGSCCRRLAGISTPSTGRWPRSANSSAPSRRVSARIASCRSPPTPRRPEPA